MPEQQGTSGIGGWIRRFGSRLGFGRKRSTRTSTAFTGAFIALAAKMAKADGIAIETEWMAFERFLDVPEHEKANVRRVYDLSKQDVAGADVLARRIREMLGDDPRLKRDVLDCLLYVACSDGVLHPAENEFVSGIATMLGFSKAEFRSIRALFVHDADSPYEVLGLSPDASDAEIKARYRAAVAEVHPDRMMAAGAPAGVIKAATAKLAAINVAHEAILAQRQGGGN